MLPVKLVAVELTEAGGFADQCDRCETGGEKKMKDLRHLCRCYAVMLLFADVHLFFPGTIVVSCLVYVWNHFFGSSVATKRARYQVKEVPYCMMFLAGQQVYAKRTDGRTDGFFVFERLGRWVRLPSPSS